MPLTSELFKLISGGATETEEPRGLGLRAEPRLPASVNLAFVLVKGVAVGKSVRVRVRDVSASGIGVEGPMPLRVNDEFAVRFELPDGQHVWVHYGVVRWQPIADNLFAAGGKYLAVIKMPAAA